MLFRSGGATQSLEENEHEGLLAYQDAIIKFDDDSGRIHAAKEDKEEIKGENPRGIAEGDEEYIPYIDIQDTASRQLEILLEDEYVSIRIDGRIAIRNLLVSNDISKSATHFALHSSVYFDEYSSQRNIFDDVYDAVFEDIMITDLSSEKNEIYSYVREAIPKLYYKLTEFMDKVQVFFIEHF